MGSRPQAGSPTSRGGFGRTLWVLGLLVGAVGAWSPRGMGRPEPPGAVWQEEQGETEAAEKPKNLCDIDMEDTFVRFTGELEPGGRAIGQADRYVRTYRIVENRPAYSVDVEIPVLEGLGDPSNRKAFNDLVLRIAQDFFIRTFIESSIEQFAEQFDEHEPVLRGSALVIDYKVTYLDPELVSVLFCVYESYALAAHPNLSAYTVNYLLQEGRTVDFPDIFVHGFDYKRRLTRQCARDIFLWFKCGDYNDPALVKTVGEERARALCAAACWARVRGERHFRRFEGWFKKKYKVPLPDVLKEHCDDWDYYNEFIDDIKEGWREVRMFIYRSLLEVLREGGTDEARVKALKAVAFESSALGESTFPLLTARSLVIVAVVFPHILREVWYCPIKYESLKGALRPELGRLLGIPSDTPR